MAKITIKKMQAELKRAALEEKQQRAQHTVTSGSTDTDIKLKQQQIKLYTGHAQLSSGQGMRVYQEDRAYAGKFSVSLTSTQSIADNLITAVELLNAKTQHQQTVGSTLIACLCLQGKIFTLNIGDSRAMIIYQNHHQQYVCHRLNRLHKPDHPQEKARIVKAGGEVTTLDVPRLNGVLAISRAIGDADVGEGLSHEPGISLFDASNQPTAHLLLCSDGITDVIEEPDIENFLNTDAWPIDDLAKRLCQEALIRNTQDNVTVLSAPAQMQAKKGALLLVADGHGGEEVAEYIKQQFPKILRQVFDDQH